MIEDSSFCLTPHSGCPMSWAADAVDKCSDISLDNNTVILVFMHLLYCRLYQIAFLFYSFVICFKILW